MAPFIGGWHKSLLDADCHWAPPPRTGCGNLVFQFITQAAVGVDGRVHLRERTGMIDIEKATNGEDADNPTGPFILVGDPVEWTYVVTNTGDVQLSNVVVTDDNGTPGNPGDDFSPDLLDSGDDQQQRHPRDHRDLALLGQRHWPSWASTPTTPTWWAPRRWVTMSPTRTRATTSGSNPTPSITIEEDATNEVGTPHTFTVTVHGRPSG